MKRGRFVRVVALWLCAAASAQPPAAPPEYRLRFHHTHTDQSLDVVYRRGDDYQPEALSRLDYFLRDYRTGDVLHYDPKLFDLLWSLEKSVGKPGAVIDVVCGYRTPRTNEYLRRIGRATAKRSMHMSAKAIDIRVPGVSTSRLRDAALALRDGGVGYYRSSDFVHVDVGRVRRW